MDLRLPPTDAPTLPGLTESERIGDAYAVVGLDARRQVVSLYRGVLDRLGAVTNAALAEARPGRIRIGGLVVTRQHPMTAKGTVFLALEDETGMVNVTLWPDTWARLRGVVRRHALLLVDGELQREASVVNVVATDVRPLIEVADVAGRRPRHARRRPAAGPRRDAPPRLTGRSRRARGGGASGRAGCLRPALLAAEPFWRRGAARRIRGRGGSACTRPSPPRRTPPNTTDTSADDASVPVSGTPVTVAERRRRDDHAGPRRSGRRPAGRRAGSSPAARGSRR